MRKIWGLTFASLLALGGMACAKTADTQTETGEAAQAQAQIAAPAGEESMVKKVLVAYYSYSGNTAAVARQIAVKTGRDLYEIKTDHAYPEAYSPMTQQVKKEIEAGFRPELAGAVPDIGQYDVVFIGTPNWWGTLAPAVSSFLEKNDFAGKTVIPFNTNGGGGMQNCEKDMRAALPNATVLEGAAFAGRSSGAPESALNKWLERLGFQR